VIISSSRRRLAGIAAAAAIVTFAISNLGETPPAHAADPTCGNVPSPSAVFPECVFYDDFTGTLLSSTALDGSKWRKANSNATNKSSVAGNCFRSGQVTVSSGQLHLTSKVLETPMNCWGFGSSAFKTRLLGALVTTDTKFTTTYGRIEFRAQLPANYVQSGTGLWMNPDTNTYNPDGKIWPYNGEIDIMERFSPPIWFDPNTVHVSLHYADKSGAITYRTTGDGNPGESLQCTVATPNAFHTYSAEWTSTRVRFFIDDVECASLGWDPANVTPPAPFDQPFNLIANQLAVDDGTTPAAGSTRVTNIDWVKVWNVPN